VRSSLKISVAIPAYNAEKYIKDAVTSIINQDYSGDIEIVITYDEGQQIELYKYSTS